MERKILAKKKSAWLIKWVEQSPTGKDIISIRDDRVPSAKIAEFVEYYYASVSYESWEMINLSKKKNPYPAHVDLYGRVTCGHKPYIRAQRVENLKIYSDGAVEYDVIKLPPREDEE